MTGGRVLIGEGDLLTLRRRRVRRFHSVYCAGDVAKLYPAAIEALVVVFFSPRGLIDAISGWLLKHVSGALGV